VESRRDTDGDRREQCRPKRHPGNPGAGEPGRREPERDRDADRGPEDPTAERDDDALGQELARDVGLARAGRPRPVTPYYLLLSATVQPEFSAALVGVKSPRQAIADARARLDHFLGAIR